MFNTNSMANLHHQALIHQNDNQLINTKTAWAAIDSCNIVQQPNKQTNRAKSGQDHGFQNSNRAYANSQHHAQKQ